MRKAVAKPTYEELAQKVKSLEGEVAKLRQAKGKDLEKIQFLDAMLDMTDKKAKVGILVVGKDGRVIFCNYFFRRIWGLTSCSVEDIRWAEILKRMKKKVDDPETIDEFFAKPLNDRGMFFDDWLYFKDGSCFDFLSGPILCWKKEYLGRSWLFINRTAEKRLYDALQDSEGRFRAIAESTSDMIHLNDQDGTIIYANKVSARKLGLPLEKIIGRPAFEFVHPDDFITIRKSMQNAAINKIVKAADEVRLLGPDGGYHHYEVRGFNVKSENGRNYIGAIIRDISERKKHEQELREKSLELEEANISLKILVRQVSESKVELEDKIAANIESLILPNLEDLAIKIGGRPERAYLDEVRRNLNRLTSTFSRDMHMAKAAFTPRELQVAGYIRHGHSSKQIAKLLDVSVRTVEFYRDNIRKKLGLNNRKINLRSHLMTTLPHDLE